MHKKKALVIDDEQIVLDSVSKILASENFEVDVSLDSCQGIDSAVQREYDIVLTDIRMPNIGGMRVLRDVRRAKPSLPIVMLTGYATVKSAVQAMKLGASDYLEKPFTPEELLNAVSSAIEKASAHPPEEQRIIHKEEMLRVLDRTASESEFVSNLLFHGVEALEEYNLTGAEKLAILTGDIAWIEQHIGSLNPARKRWFEDRLTAEIW
jgi:DNA-binding NtrC family response regulator